MTKNDILQSSIDEAVKEKEMIMKECIAFAKWLSHNCYDKEAASLAYNWEITENEWLISMDGMTKKTTEELYSLYLQSKEK